VDSARYVVGTLIGCRVKLISEYAGYRADPVWEDSEDLKRNRSGYSAFMMWSPDGAISSRSSGRVRRLWPPDADRNHFHRRGAMARALSLKALVERYAVTEEDRHLVVPVSTPSVASFSWWLGDTLGIILMRAHSSLLGRSANFCAWPA
jgi:hypothetical protein